MKRTLVLVFALLLLAPSLALADVIVEPENSFYRTHQSECQHREGRTYLANGPEGTLALYTAPNGTVSKTLQNGAALYCQWTYTDGQGVVWGFSDDHEAWAPLGYTLVQYDHISFEEEHSDTIVSATDMTEKEYATVFLYEYPGASDPIRLDAVRLAAQKSYTDEQGRLWGFVSYIYGIRNRWFCLDDPDNEALAGQKKDAQPSSFASPEKLPTVTRTGVLAGAVGGVSLVTLILVLGLFRKRKKA